MDSKLLFICNILKYGREKHTSDVLTREASDGPQFSSGITAGETHPQSIQGTKKGRKNWSTFPHSLSASPPHLHHPFSLPTVMFSCVYTSVSSSINQIPTPPSRASSPTGLYPPGSGAAGPLPARLPAAHF